MIRVLGKIWKRYSGKLIDILKRDGGEKAVSVEMEVLDFDKIKSLLKNPVIFDGRNQYNAPRLLEKGFTYYQIGKIL